MTNNKPFILPVLITVLTAVILFLGAFGQQESQTVDAVSSASTTAYWREPPEDVFLRVDGMVKQLATYNGGSLRMLARSRIRIHEVTPQKDILGSYIYTGIPVLYLLEATAPKKPDNAAFNRPLDMVVVFTSASGKHVSFSYGELTMADDTLPVMLAFHREGLKSSRDPEKYKKNKLPDALEGLRLVCPAEPDNRRFLDNVTRMTLTLPDYPEKLLPEVVRQKECSSQTITCVASGKTWKASFDGVPKSRFSNWVRFGHGRGLKGDKPWSASGISLTAFLEHNFKIAGDKGFFLFAGCDGYRAVFSARELFATHAGARSMIITHMNGTPTKNGYTLGPVKDFYVDRDIRGLSHILYIETP